MQLKVQVITREHRTWPAREGMQAGESFNLICQDMSLPGEDRMTENLAYRLKDEEVKKFWEGTTDKTLMIVCRKISTNKSGKASIIGEIKEIAK